MDQAAVNKIVAQTLAEGGIVQPQPAIEPVASDLDLLDPQSAMASQGQAQLAQAALNSAPVQNAITGKGLADYNSMVNAARSGDPQAQLALANHSNGLAMGTIAPMEGYGKPLFTPGEARVAETAPGAAQKLQQTLGQTSTGGYVDQILEAKRLADNAAELASIAHPQVGQKELAIAVQRNNAAIDRANRLAAQRKGAKGYAEGGTIESAPEASAEAPQDPGAYVYNLKSGELGTIPHNQVTEAIASGEYSFPKDMTIPVFDKEGQLGNIPPEQAPDAFRQGFKYASPLEEQEYDLQQKYGEGAGNMLKSAALGAGNTLSFGGLNQALARSGLVSQEALKQIPERNPISNTAGSAAAILGSLALGPEAALNPISQLSKLGGKVAGGVEGLLPEATSIGGQIARNAVAKGAGSAVEGLAYGAGKVAEEEAIGDPNLNAESAIAQIGLTGLLGGALGGALGAGEIAIPESVSLAKEAIQKARDTFIGKPGEGKLGDVASKAASKVMALASGKSEEDIATALANRRDLLNSPKDVEKFSSDLSKSLQDQYSAMEKASKDTFKEVRGDETAELLKDIPAENVQPVFNQVGQSLRDTIKAMRNESEIYPQSYPSKLEKLAERFENAVKTKEVSVPEEVISSYKKELAKVQEDNALRTSSGLEPLPLPVKPEPTQVNTTDADSIFRAINDLKQNIDKEIKYGKLPSAADQDAQTLIKKLRGEIKETLENPEVFGEAGTRQTQFNDASSSFDNVKKEFEKKFMTKTVSKSGAVKYKVDPVKINSYLNQIKDIRGSAKSDILNSFNKTSQDYLDQIEKSYSTLPAKEFDKEAVQKLSDKSLEMQSEFKRQADINDAFKRLESGGGSSLEDAAGAYAAHALGVPAPIIAAAAAARNPYLTIQRLAKFEKLVQKTNAVVSKGAKALFKPGISLAEDTAGYLASRVIKNDNKDDYSKRSKDIEDHISSPQLLMERLEKSTDKLHNHAPNNAYALQESGVRALTFLQSKLPAEPPHTPLGNTIPMTKSDINKFNRYYEAVENPLSVFKQMKAGLLTSEAVEALQAVHPNLYAKMKQEVIENIGLLKEKRIPYKIKNQLSLFMGEDMDLTTSSQSIASNQAAQNQAQQEQQSAPNNIRTTAKGLGNISISTRALTNSQTNQRR